MAITSNPAPAAGAPARAPDRPLRALFWMTLSAIGFSLMAVYVKMLAPVIPHFQLVFVRAFVNLCVVLPWMLHAREPLVPSRRDDIRLLLLRGLAGFAGLSCLFYTVSHLPLSISMLLGWTSPVFVILFSWLFLRERLLAGQLAGIGVAFLGMVLLVLRFDSGREMSLATTLALPPLPFLVGVVGAAFSGLAYVAVRAATARVGVNTIILYFVTVATLLSAPFAARDFAIPTLTAGLQLLAMGLVASFGQFTMTQGFRHAPAGLVSAMSLLNAAFSAVLGWIVFDERLNTPQWVGLIIVAGSVLFLGLFGYRSGAPRKAAPDGQEPVSW